MERITPNEPTSKGVADSDDPFGDSFTNFPVCFFFVVKFLKFFLNYLFLSSPDIQFASAT